MRIIVDTGTDTPTLVHHALSLIEDLLTAGAFGGTASQKHIFNDAELATPQPHIHVGATVTTGAPSAPPAPVAAIVPPLPPTGEMDGQGTPWDARIHSGSKSVTDAGTWRRRKGVDEATYNAVMAELHPAQHGVVQTAPMPAPVAPVAPVVPPAPPAIIPPPPPVAPVAPAPPPLAPVPPAPVYTPPAAPFGAVVEWPEVCTLMNEKLTANKIGPDFLTGLGTKYLGAGMPFALIATRPDLFASIKAEFLAVA